MAIPGVGEGASRDQQPGFRNEHVDVTGHAAREVPVQLPGEERPLQDDRLNARFIQQPDDGGRARRVGQGGLGISGDLRVQKGFQVAGTYLRLFADVRNPLDLENTNAVFLETGAPTNDAYREVFLAGLMGDQLMDGDATIDDFNILTEFPAGDNALNQYSSAGASTSPPRRPGAD